MNLPNIAGALSDSDKLKWSNLAQKQAELKELKIVTDDFLDLLNWNEHDTGGKVNLVSQVVQFDGNNNWGQNGIDWNGGQARAEMVFEGKFRIGLKMIGGGRIALTNSPGLPIPPTGQLYLVFSNDGFDIWDNGYQVGDAIAYDIDTWYTIRFRVGKSADGSSWQRVKITIQGGDYTSETAIFDNDCGSLTYTDPVYFSVQRYANAASYPFEMKEYRVHSGYAQDGPTIEFIHDAGIGNKFKNLDLTNLAFPGSISSVNKKIAWSFDDSPASYSGFLTLAELNALGKQTANKQFIRFKIRLDSDGITPVYAAKIDAANATDWPTATFPAPSVPVGQILQEYNKALLISSSFVTNATGIKVFRDTDPGGAFPEIAGSPFAFYEILDDNGGAGLAENTPYYYKLKGTGPGGDSAFSAIFAGRTIIGTPHQRKLIRDKAVQMLTNKVYYESTILGVYKTRFLSWFPAELPAIGIYILEEPADDELTAPREYSRFPALMIEIILEKNHIEDSDDVLDYFAKQVENIFFLNNTMDDLVDDLKLQDTKITPKIDGKDIFAAITLNWEIKYRTDAPEAQGPPLVEDLEKSDVKIGVGGDEVYDPEHAIEAEIDHTT